MIKISYNTNKQTDWQWFPRHKQKDDQECIAEACAEQIRKERNLPPGTPVAVYVSCSCPRCTPYV